jgi:hypothetical protein
LSITDPRDIINTLAQQGHFRCVGIEDGLPVYQITDHGHHTLAANLVSQED